MQRFRLALILALLFCGSRFAASQSTDWSVVQALHPGQPLRISAGYHGQSCDFISADERSVTCQERHSIFFVPFYQRVLFRKEEVRSIKESHRVRSYFAGAAIGAAAGVALVAAIVAGRGSNYTFNSLGSLLLTVAGFSAGGSIGEATDFLAGPVLYRAS